MKLPKNSKSYYVNIAGGNLHYIVCNPSKARTIVMLHGFTGNHLGLATFMHELGDFTLIVPDFPGFGYSTPMTKHPHTIAGYADAMSEFIAKISLKNPPYILGHSFGTVVGARLAANYPQLVADKIVLISSAAVLAFKNGWASKIATHIGEAHYALGVHAGKLGDRWLKNHTISKLTTAGLIKTQDPKIRQAIFKHHINDLDFLQHKKIYQQAYKSFNRDDVLNYAEKIKQHVLIISGECDDLWPPKAQKVLHQKLKSSQLVLLPNVGHLTHFEAPQKIGELVNEFLS